MNLMSIVMPVQVKSSLPVLHFKENVRKENANRQERETRGKECDQYDVTFSDLICNLHTDALELVIGLSNHH